jgi:glycosyltransferase involved in cell wall biosynthesis
MKNKDEILLSIVIPVYNTGERIEKCIESISKIRSIKYEVVFIDDGSKDNSYEIIKRSVNKYKIDNFQLYTQENMGPSSARNNGILKSVGRYIFFVDADDFINANCLEDIFSKEEILNFDTIMFENSIINKNNQLIHKKNSRFDGNFIYETDKQKLYEKMISSFDMNCLWNNIYSNEIIKNNEIFFNSKIKNGEDFLFNAQYFLKSSKGIYFQTEVYNYVYSENGITNTFYFNKFYDLSETYETRRELAKLVDKEKSVRLVKDMNNMYLKVIVRYIALAKISKYSDKQITNAIFGKSFEESVQKNSNDKLYQKLIKKIIRLKLYALISILFKIKNML